MGIVDHGKLKSNYLGVVEELAGHHAAGLIHPYVSAETIEDVSVRSSFTQYDREFTFFGDEALDRGGHDRGPSPIRYFLSGIAFCMLGWYAKGAAFAECEVEGLGMNITTHLDLRGEHGFEDKPIHIQWLVFDVQVDSPSSADSVLANVAVSSDLGGSWRHGENAPVPGAIYGSAIAHDETGLIAVAVSPAGAAFTTTVGMSWTSLPGVSAWAVEAAPTGTMFWAAGAEGRILLIAF